MSGQAVDRDESMRAEATDPRRSFIVQAPAGSGKTELLIQRYLTLLETVDEPEQIVAITFTRKSAAEMRNRIGAALLAAEETRPVARAHERKTRELARAALRRDVARGWQLAANPRRLRIETVDALNGWLARRLPVLSGGVGGAGVAEDAEPLYLAAAERTVAELHGGSGIAASLETLLEQLDNDVMRLEAMLAELMPRRDQWLPYFASPEAPALRGLLEDALERLVAEELAAARAVSPPEVIREVAPLLRHAARHADPRNRERFSAFGAGADGDALAGLAGWQALAHLLVTGRGTWRRRVDKRLGFGPRHKEARRRLEELLQGLEGDAALLQALTFVRALPEPAYTESQWRTLAALRAVLRRAAAELRLIFAETEVVDFVELALAARSALGAVDRPSELLLALDRRIRHVLVDEFQDTSHSQLRLLELLTAGWEPDDGRTLFLVGDPMQSIYRFRDADMSLFLRVKHFGLGGVHCRPLVLERNFRSAPAVLDWVNATFALAFPEQDDIGAGAAKFSPSYAARERRDDTGVQVHALETENVEDELAAAIEVVELERRRSPEQSIAVLVQSRSHLAGLHAQLRVKGLAVRAAEIEPLREHQVVQDLLALTRALTHAADRAAWLAVLRAPWCGLGWRDLAALSADDHERTVAELMREPERLQRLSPDGRGRLLWLRSRLDAALQRRVAVPFAEWLEETWIGLDGPSCLDGADELRYAGQFFSAMERVARCADVPDPAVLERVFAKPEAQVEASGEGGIEIMTIHRAKGLEFDTVVLLGLGREPRREAGKALYWMQRVADDGSEDLIMAPLARNGEDDALGRFVQRAERARDLAERTRLLYVASTRARERLHLVCRVAPGLDAPAERTLLSALWPQVVDRFSLEAQAEATARERSAEPPERAGEESFEPVLRRLAWEGRPAAEPDAGAGGELAAGSPTARDEPAGAALKPEFEWAGQPAVQVGTLVHARLHRIAEEGLSAWSTERVAESREDFERELSLLGLDAEEVPVAASRVVEALVGVLDDERGRWILERHEQARSELRLTVPSGSTLEHVQLDRTFVADGVRWIIDFKTGAHEGAEPRAFLDAEVARYRLQLERYARAMRALENRPIRVALYFPLLQAFRFWEPSPAAS